MTASTARATAVPQALLAPAAPVGGTSMVPTAYRVRDRRRETHDTVTLVLAPTAVPLAVPEPGQFMMVWSPGVGEVPVSVAGCSVESSELHFTVRAVGATSAALVAAAPGAVLGLRGPFGRAWTVPSPEQGVVVVAGGLGLAPLRMLVERLLDQERSGPVELVVGARNPAEIVYEDLLVGWGRRARVSLSVDRPSRSWRGDVGLVTSALSRLELAAGTRAAVCGPEIMMRLVAGDLLAAGLRADDIEVSLERSMACAVGHCGRCQLGPVLVCRDGAVMPWSSAAPLMEVRRW
jgi:NAD(P)H-flavin reductase